MDLGDKNIVELIAKVIEEGKSVVTVQRRKIVVKQLFNFIGIQQSQIVCATIFSLCLLKGILIVNFMQEQTS